jgi:2'-5' RNA ligase
MTRYLIDIRMMGPVARQVRALGDELAAAFRLKSRIVVPHITLAGPFHCDDGERLFGDFARVCTGRCGIPQYTVGGYGVFPVSRAVYVAVEPDAALRLFRYDLSRTLAPYCTLREYDHAPADAFVFHATIAMKLDWLTFQRVRWHIRNRAPVIHRPHLVRATLLANGAAVCEYDFVQGRMLSPAQARGRATRMRDRDMLRAWDDEWPG